MSPESAQTFQIGPVAFWSIIAGLVVVSALAIEQLYVFWGLVEQARQLAAEVGKALYHGDLAAARTACERSDSPVADIFIAALNKVNRPGQSIFKAAERERQRVALALRKRLWALGTVGALAPFVGLLGTVLGVIRALHDMAASGAGGFNVVYQGVAEALVATAGGLAVAIFSVVLFNFFQVRGNRTATEIKLLVDEFLEQLSAAREPETAPKEP